MHLNHVVLLPYDLILFGVIEARFKVLGERLVVFPFIFELGLLELGCFC
jgi:hypothetical protein